jgi:2-polyprenyl-6-methoxyphenol hydroxylase-like FAD-dependent oxidoreductase
LARAGGEVPHVIGVRLEDGTEADADLVVDASGRWTKAADWLAAIGARPWVEDFQETPVVYLTRWYRLRPGESFPYALGPVFVPVPYMPTFAFPADNDSFAIAMAPSMSDPLRGQLLEPEVFGAYAETVPQVQAWASRGTPITDPLPLARINNCRRWLIDRDGPIVTGFVMLGDAANHTNPTFGRGASLGFSQAQHLARSVETAASPAAFAQAFSDWTDANIGCWRQSQQEADGFFARRAQAAIAGEAPPAPPPQFLFRQAMAVLADRDAEVAAAFARETYLLCPAGTAEADPVVAAKVRAFLESGPPAPPPAGPSRREFEALVAATASGRRGRRRIAV